MVAVAKIAYAVDVAEEIERPGFGAGRGAQDAAPDFRGVRSSHRLAILIPFGQFEADGADIGTEIERLDFEDVHGHNFKISNFKRKRKPRQLELQTLKFRISDAPKQEHDTEPRQKQLEDADGGPCSAEESSGTRRSRIRLLVEVKISDANRCRPTGRRHISALQLVYGP